MLRLLATLVLLLYVANSECATTQRNFELCDPSSCSATCTKQFEGWKDVHALGRCENNECHCYHRSLCEAKACANSCRERYGNESNLRSKCVDDVCNCGWDKRCQQSECESQCAQIYPGKSGFQAYCKDNVCICKWEEGYQKAAT